MGDDAKVASFWNYYFRQLPNSGRALGIVLNGYSTPGRHYHGLSHLVHGLAQVDDLPDMPIVDEEALVLAWFCHDLRYNARIPDLANVKASARRAVILSKAMGFEHKEQRNSAKAVLATCHSLPPESLIEKCIVDLDLSILGADKLTYKNYEAGIRKEYAWVPFEDYKKARVSVLQNFLEKERLYWLDFFHDKYDASRKENLKWSIRVLEANTDFLK